MNKTILFFVTVILFSYTSLSAQEDSLSDDGIETLAGSNLKFSGFIGPSFHFSQLSSDLVYYSGTEGALLIDKTYYIGGYGTSLRTNVYPSALNSSDYSTKLRHGGLLVGYIFRPASIIHLNAGLKAGWGSITLVDKKNYFVSTIDEASIAIFTPELNAEVNLTRYLRFSLGVHYQLVAGAHNMEYFSNTDLSKPGIQLKLLLGWFK